MPTHEVRPSAFVSCLLLAGSLLTALPLAAQEAPQGGGLLSSLAFSDARLRPTAAVAPLEAVQSSIDTELRSRWASFQAASPVRWQAYVDQRTGHLESAVGGGIRWVAAKGTTDLKTLEAAARAMLPGIAPLLGIDADPAALELDRGRSGRQEDHLWYVDFNVRREGLIVEGARVVFRVSHGNLIEIGAENLPSADAAVPAARIGHEQALAALSSFVGGFSAADSFVDGGSLHLLPVNLSDPAFATGFAPGEGRGLVLVWEIVFLRRGEGGTWRARIDAESGRVIELVDLNRYGRVAGGAFPISPVSTPEATLPMPFADVPPAGFADSAGFFTSASTVTSKLDGKYVKVNDACGPISKSSDWTGEIGFGSSGGTDCTTPGSGGNGNTHSARTQFYHVNRIKEAGRAWLPANTWLQGKLTVNVNINLTCNAYWSPAAGTINFYRSGGGCANTGEIAAVSLHEYGHGLDQNDGGGSSPDAGTGETYGDFTSALATHDSCIGPGFRTTNCGGNGDPCTACTGVRDIDFAKHNSNTPATVANFTQVRCGGARPDYPGPCGTEGHCESYVASEALWDFAARDLPNPGSAAAWTITERLWYLSRATSSSAFSCTTSASPWTSTGCATGSLWRTLRAADDDDGNLTNGTPHSCQLFAAFNRHNIACASDPGANVCFSGCTPPDAPALTVTPGLGQVQLGWTSSGAGVVYDLYRSEINCGAGFVRIADSLATTSYTDTLVSAGLSYSYQLVAHPTGGTSCSAAPTSCQSATPSAAVCTPPAAPAGLNVVQTTIARIDLSWPAVAGAAGYNVYRAATAGGPYTLRATVTSGTAYSDTGLNGSTSYFYKVRAFANACESADSVVATGTTQACTTVSLYQEDFETGTGLSSWTLQVLTGGSATNDWRGIQACTPTHSGTKIFRFGGATCGAIYGNGEIALATPPVITVPAGVANTKLSFWHRRDFEAGFDGARFVAAIDGSSTFTFGPDSALSGATYDNAISSGAGACPPGAMGGVSSFTGTQGTMVNTVVDLDAFCDAATSGTGGCAGHTVKPGFLAISDCSVAGAGWFLDDIQVTTCQPDVAGPVPGYYTVTPCRLIDTRDPAGPLGGPALPAGGERLFLAAGSCGIPFTAKALAINLTVVAPTSPGFLQALPGGSPVSQTSSISFNGGVTRANNGILKLDGIGGLLVRSGATAPVDFIVDVTGYFQ